MGGGDEGHAEGKLLAPLARQVPGGAEQAPDPMLARKDAEGLEGRGPPSHAGADPRGSEAKAEGLAGGGGEGDDGMDMD